MKKIEAIIRSERLQAVQDALDELGASGLTVTEVMGCGRQKGYTEQYRGSRANISLLPKIKVESVVPDHVIDQAVPISLERNREAAVEMGAVNPPDVPVYRFRLGLRAGFSGDQSAAIPVFKKVNPHPHPVLKEIFYCEVAGTDVEAANVHALRDKVARVLETLAPGKALPIAYFRVPAMDYSLPVYE